MITNMQIVNHVREDGIYVLAIFNLDGFSPWRCHLLADNRGSELSALGLRKSTRGLRWVRMSDSVIDAAFVVYQNSMSKIFGYDWNCISDGRTRMLEWVYLRGAENQESCMASA